MASWQAFKHLFNVGPTQPWPTPTETPANPGFDNLFYDWVLGTNYPNALSADGTGRVIRLPPTLDPIGGISVFSASNIGGTAWPTYYSYLVKPEPTTAATSKYRAAIRFKCVHPYNVTDGNTITQVGLCFRHKLSGSATGSGVQRREIQSEFQWTSSGGNPNANVQITSKWDNNSNLGGAFGNTQTFSATGLLDTYLWLTGEITTVGGVTSLVTKLYKDTGSGVNGFDPDDYESGVPLATTTTQSSSHAEANQTGYCGFYCAGGFRTPPGWEVTDFVTFLEVTDTQAPILIGGSLDMDGKTLRARFGETSLPLASSGGALTGFTFEKRNGYSGAWSTITTGTPVVDDADGSQIKAIATTAIPPGWDIRCTYNSGTGNLVDDAGNAAATGTGYFANYSKVDPSLNVTHPEMLVGTRGWLRVSGRTAAVGYEGQSTRDIALPYGCSSAGIKLYWEGFSEGITGTGLTVQILGAGVRAVQPDGTVSTHTLTFNGSGTTTTTIAYNAMDWAPLVAAFPPGTQLYVTTWYKEAAGGNLPYQWQEIIDRAYAGRDDFCSAHEVGLIGTLTSKILLGGTSSGPTHTTAAPTLAGPDARSYTYGPAYILGLPSPTFAGTPKPLLVLGNSMAIDSVIKPIGDYICGDHKDPKTLDAYCTTGVGGSIAASFLTSVSANAPTQLLIGTTSANTKIARAVELYGHNEVRAPQTGVTHPTGHIQYLWNMRVSCAAVFQNLAITYLTTTISPIQSGWMNGWASELREMVPKVIATHNAELLSRWQAIPGVSGVADLAIGSGSPRSSDRGAESPADPRGGYSDWRLPTNQTAGDGLHGTALHTALRAAQILAEFLRIEALATSGGGGGGGAGALIGGGLIR